MSLNKKRLEAVLRDNFREPVVFLHGLYMRWPR